MSTTGYGMAVGLWLAACAFVQAEAVDKTLPAYRPQGAVAGSLRAVGSTTVAPLVTGWAEGLRAHHPQARVEVRSVGSGAAMTALLDGTADVGMLSRPLKPEEAKRFRKARGHDPTVVRVAMDLLAVYVNDANPVRCLALAEVDGMFSTSRKRGGANLATWAQAGATGALAATPIVLHGRAPSSGTFDFFKEHALDGGQPKPYAELGSGEEIVKRIAADPAAVGYAGIGARVAGVRPLAIAARKGGACAEPTFENGYLGGYPLSRELYLVVDRKPGQPLSPAVTELLRFALSREGQESVAQNHFLPLLSRLAAVDRQKAGID